MIHFFCFIFPSTGTKCELQYIEISLDLGIHAYQRNLGSHVTVRMSAPSVRKTGPKLD